jgi:hypothetical protein
LIEGRVVIQGSMRIGRNHSFKEVKIVEAWHSERRYKIDDVMRL